MQHSSQPRRWRHVLGAAAAIAVVGLAGCAEPAEEATSSAQPVTIEQLDGSELARLTLTEKAAERLGIQTAPVTAEAAATTSGGGQVERSVVPYAAVFYDRTGQTWAYTNPEPLVFVRQGITVDHISGQRAVLSDGPAVGMPVVTVGATELFGAEVGVDH